MPKPNRKALEAAVWHMANCGRSLCKTCDAAEKRLMKFIAETLPVERKSMNTPDAVLAGGQ